MAEYNIILNLSGNASRNAASLARSLAAANVSVEALKGNVASLSASLGTIGTQGIRNVTTELNRATAAAARLNRQRVIQRLGRFQGSTIPPRRIPTRPTQPNYTRHTGTSILSYGYGTSVGGFSARMSRILQPDANGNILGMNAARLASTLNTTAIATNIMSSIGKSLLKFTASMTIAPIAIGGLGIMTSLRALRSESFAEGVRLISRRHMARMGLGDAYEQGNRNADFLASGYGFDRSTTLSSINVLTGLGVGGTDRKISLGEATGLTKIGGLISQQAGVPFERVMTNIQQLLVQATPNIRDIRELLNQAPVLGKYALREMESRGMSGVDVRTYLKDQSNLLSVLRSYELDNASNAGMQARGRIALAKQDAWATIASNNPFWSYVGRAGSGIIGAMGGGVNNLLTNLSENREFQIMVKQIELMFDTLGTKGVTFMDKLISLIDGLAARFGIDLGDKQEAARQVNVDETLKAAANNPYIIEEARKMWESSTLPIAKDKTGRDREFYAFLEQSALPHILQSDDVRRAVSGSGRLRPVSEYSWGERFIGSADLSARSFNSGVYNRQPPRESSAVQTRYAPPVRSWTEPNTPFARYTIRNGYVVDAIARLIDETSQIGGLDPSKFRPNGGGGVLGDDLTGMNKDRRALEIHFHNKLVEWNSTITTNDPQEVLETVATDMEQLVASSIQKALLGAAGRAGNSWY